MIKKLPVCIALIGALALGGCGGGDSDTSTSTGESAASGSVQETAASGQESGNSNPRLSFNERFAKSPANDGLTEEINAICKSGKDQGAQAMSLYLKKHGGSQPTDQQVIAGFRATVAPEIERDVKEIRALRIPADANEAVEGFAVALSEVPYTASKNATRVAFINYGFEHIDELARILELDACVYKPIAAG